MAELEATSATKGNRVVGLQIYGQVNKALLIWDDGPDSDIYVVDNNTSSSRFGLIGEGRIKPQWYAGYRIEMEMKSAASDEVFNGDTPTDPIIAEDMRLRHNYVYIENEQLGRVSLGQQSPVVGRYIDHQPRRQDEQRRFALQQ